MQVCVNICNICIFRASGSVVGFQCPRIKAGVSLLGGDEEHRGYVSPSLSS